jgi:hypothetical protein
MYLATEMLCDEKYGWQCCRILYDLAGKEKTEVEGRVPLTRAAPRRVKFNHPNIIAALNAPAEHALDSGRCNPKEDVKTWPSSSSSAA